MARIRFLSDQVYASEGPGKGPLFTKGFVLDAEGVGKALGRDVTPEWAAGFLHRWVQRGVAAEVDRRTPTLEEIEEARLAEEKKEADDALREAEAAKKAEDAAKKAEDAAKAEDAVKAEDAAKAAAPKEQPQPVATALVSQPLGTAKRGRD